MKNNREIGQQLLTLRNSKHWTQEQLAAKLNVSRQAVSKWETGMALPDLPILLQLSELYEITINALISEPVLPPVQTIEDLIAYESDKCRQILEGFTPDELALATKGVSPDLNQLIEACFPDMPFEEIRAQLGRVQINAIEHIHTKIVDEANRQLSIL